MGGVGGSLHAFSTKYMAYTMLLPRSMYFPYFAPDMFYMLKHKWATQV